jgi:hypothetical protein
MNDNKENITGQGLKAIGTGFIWAVAIIFFLGVISWGIWFFCVATAPVVGRGNQHIQINSAENRTFQYQRFFDLDATIRAQALNLDAAKKDLAAFNAQFPPSASEGFAITESRNNKSANVTGLRQILLSNITQYNNDAQEWTRNQFLDNKLPDHFDTSIADDPSLLPPPAGGRR